MTRVVPEACPRDARETQQQDCRRPERLGQRDRMEHESRRQGGTSQQRRGEDQHHPQPVRITDQLIEPPPRAMQEPCAALHQEGPEQAGKHQVERPEQPGAVRFRGVEQEEGQPYEGRDRGPEYPRQPDAPETEAPGVGRPSPRDGWLLIFAGAHASGLAALAACAAVRLQTVLDASPHLIPGEQQPCAVPQGEPEQHRGGGETEVPPEPVRLGGDAQQVLALVVGEENEGHDGNSDRRIGAKP